MLVRNTVRYRIILHCTVVIKILQKHLVPVSQRAVFRIRINLCGSGSGSTFKVNPDPEQLWKWIRILNRIQVIQIFIRSVWHLAWVSVLILKYRTIERMLTWGKNHIILVWKRNTCYGTISAGTSWIRTPVLWIWNYFVRIRIPFSSEFWIRIRIRILLD
jgi:hypothetical protein